MPAMLAVACCFCALSMTVWMNALTLPGVIEPRLLIKLCVVECPSSPRIETRTSRPGKIACTP